LSEETAEAVAAEILKVLDDGEITPEEEAKVEQVIADLDLPEEAADDVLQIIDDWNELETVTAETNEVLEELPAEEADVVAEIIAEALEDEIFTP